jgi:hypothetical protein
MRFACVEAPRLVLRIRVWFVWHVFSCTRVWHHATCVEARGWLPLACMQPPCAISSSLRVGKSSCHLFLGVDICTSAKKARMIDCLHPSVSSTCLVAQSSFRPCAVRTCCGTDVWRGEVFAGSNRFKHLVPQLQLCLQNIRIQSIKSEAGQSCRSVASVSLTLCLCIMEVVLPLRRFSRRHSELRCATSLAEEEVEARKREPSSQILISLAGISGVARGVPDKDMHTYTHIQRQCGELPRCV